ncbi:MAG: substrate-binding domain-containing protein [Hahellaceae bacterium]|nr:substrate-binding domain-containing protein [Hahellaceae bacterium]
MQAFRQSHPVVRIELKQVNDLLASLREGVVDIAIIGEASSDRLIHYTPLVEDEMCAVLSESAELNATDYLWLDDLQGADLIYFFDLESSYLYQRYLKPNHIRLGSFQHIQDFPTLLAQVASGNGVSILPRRLLASLPEAASCKMLPIGREGYFFNWYAASRLHQFTPVTRAFLSLLQEMLV